MDQQTWTTLLGMAGFTLALFGYLRSMKAEISDEIGRLGKRMDDGFTRVDSRLTMLEQRTFELASRLPAPPLQPPRSSVA